MTRPGLARYRAKRNFSRTREPAGKRARKSSRALTFVVQKHAARRLHYDFRLEWTGTLKSWAVPKGPSLDPEVKRLAVEVEDHPLEYASFEGDIPKGEYGAGHVDRWDHGTWTPLGDAARMFAKGHLEFELAGERLNGRWHLVRTRGAAAKPQWLLFKGTDRSPVRTSRDFPAALEPQLATLSSAPPEGDGWLYELKYDGIRLLSRVNGDAVRCYSRNAREWTAKLPELVEALGKLGLRESWLDAELVALDAHGHSDFSLLQKRLERGERDELVLCVFDAPVLFGVDLRGEPLTERKRQLRRALASIPEGGSIRLADALESDANALLDRVCRQQLEGLIAKRLDAPYRSGRSTDWLKLKCRREQEFVVGGATYLPGRAGLSSLLVGYHEDGAFVYAGRVGSGIGREAAREWRARIEKHARATSPFASLPARRPGERFRFVAPRFVVQVAFASWTSKKILRQPRYLGLRDDKPAKAISREPDLVATLAAKPLDVKLTHPERVLFPQDGVTKLQLARYFVSVADWLLPQLEDRPLSILRNTSGNAPFFQKHFAKGAPKGLRLVPIKTESGREPYMVCSSRGGLLELAQLGAVELHTWGSHLPQPLRADRLTFDFDPDPALPWARVAEAALALRTLLEDLELVGFAKTSGGKGLHVVVPLRAPLQPFAVAKQFALDVARVLVALAPERLTARAHARNRKGKIFIDYLRNGVGATTVAAFSPRWRPGVPVSMPIAWEELAKPQRAPSFTLASAPAHLADRSVDPWQAYTRTRQSLTAARRKRLSELLGSDAGA